MRKSVWPGLRICLPLALMLVVAGCSDGSITVTNSPPSAVIEAPSIGTEVFEGAEVLFRGVVEDRSTVSSELIVTWSSSLDGELMSGNADSEGVTEFATTELSGGTHTITLQVRDSGGVAGNATLELVVREDAAPSITIVSPTAEGVNYSDLPVTLQASVNDAEDDPEALLVSWAVDGGEVLATDLEPDSTGLATGSSMLAGGTYVLVATVTDTAGRTATATVTIVVGPPNTAPTCEITAPASLSTVPLGELVLLEGTVADVDVPADWLEVSFESNVDGPLGTAPPSTAGEVGLATSALTAATHTITMDVADEVGGTCSHFIFLTVSTPPSATITTPTSGDPLNVGDTLTLSGTVSDVEDADDSLGVTWESDIDGVLGSPSPDSSGAVALNFSLPAGPHLLTLTATDSAGLTGTDTVTVSVNTTPTVPLISITPAAPTTANDLTVIIDTASTDADGAPLALSYSYAWTRGGNPQGPFSPPETVPAAQTSRDDVWEITVTATDGQASSAGATAQVTVGNSAPSVASVDITPTTAYTDTTLTANPAGWSDADGDTPSYLYEWFAGSSAVGSDAATLAGSEFVKGDLVTVQVTPNDASSSGSPVVSNPGVTILNTPPTAPGVTISPAAPDETQDLICSVSSPSSDVDPGDSVTYAYSWQESGGGSGTGATLPSSATAAGETWTCEVTPNDGEDNGPAGSASVGPVAGSNSCMSLSFDGSNDEVSIPHSNSLNLGGSSYTVEAWVKRAGGTGTTDSIFSKRASSSSVGWAMLYHNGISAFRHTLNQSGYANLDAPDTRTGQWVHVAATYDHGTGLRALWLDGNLADSGVVSFSSYASTAELRLGWDGRFGDGYYFDGGLDEMRMSSDVLYTSAFTPGFHLSNGATTVALWKFDSGNGSIAIDTSGNGHNGTINGAAWVADCPSVASCVAGDGTDAACPATSCLQILNDGYSIGDGNYWIDPDGAGAFEAYCDMTGDGGGWTTLLVATANSAAWGALSGNWSAHGTDSSVPLPLGIQDHHSPAYGRLSTQSVRLCYQDSTQCFVMNHNQSASLRDFFALGLTFIDWAYNTDHHPDTGPVSRVDDYLAGLGVISWWQGTHNSPAVGGYYFECGWLGINELSQDGIKLGLTTDNNTPCANFSGGTTTQFNDGTWGVGANFSDLGSSYWTDVAGVTRSNSGFANYGPWIAFGRE